VESILGPGQEGLPDDTVWRQLFSGHGQAVIDMDLELGLYLSAAAVFGAIIGWLIRVRQSSRSLNQMGDQWQSRFDLAIRQKDQLSAENTSLKSSLEEQHAVVQRHTQAATKTRTETESLREKASALTKNLFVVREEQDSLKEKMSRAMGLINAAKQRILEQQAALAKVGDFYKGQQDSAVDQRAVLERKIVDAKSEIESLRNLLVSAKAEHNSVSNLLASSQSRLENLDVVERKVISLEAENAELRQAATLAKREAEALQRDVAEMDALKVQNQELTQFVESIESSRKQLESDAHRYRNQYEESEKLSDTLRFKLGDIEKNWAEMQRKDNQARQADPQLDTGLPPFGLVAPQGEPDDLTEIVGVGKVFEETLHSLGVYHFRQIAAFGPSEIARINSELKEFKGRIEHDDWVGQARELHFRNHSDTDE